MNKNKYKFESTYAVKFNDAIKNLENFNREINKERLASITAKVSLK